MIQCKNCGTSYNVTFSQCPMCGKPNPTFQKPSQPSMIIDKVAFTQGNIKQIEQTPENEVTTIVSFHIPFLLHLVDGTYEMKYGKKWIVIQLTRVNEPPEYTRKFFGIGMKFPKNAEIPKDRFGRLAHSHVTVFIPERILDDHNNFVYECPKCGTELSSSSTACPLCEATFTLEEAKKPAHSIIKLTALKYFNRFLELYRFYSREYHIEPIKDADIISFQCDYMIKGRTVSGYKYVVDTGSGGIKSGSAFLLSDDIHKQLRGFLMQGNPIEIEELLLCNSKNHLLTQEYPIAIIEAVSALETTLSEFIRTECEIASIGDEKVEKFIHDVGVSGQVKVVLKLLTKGKPQLDDTVFSECEGAITLRNNVVHKGFLDLSSKDVKQKIISIERMLRYVQSIQSRN